MVTSKNIKRKARLLVEKYPFAKTWQDCKNIVRSVNTKDSKQVNNWVAKVLYSMSKQDVVLTLQAVQQNEYKLSR